MAVAQRAGQQVCGRGDENHVVAIRAHGVASADGIRGDSRVWRIGDGHPHRAGNASTRDAKTRVSHEDILTTASGKLIIRRQVRRNRAEGHETSVRTQEYICLIAGTPPPLQLPIAPSLARETKLVTGVQPAGAPAQVSRTYTFPQPLDRKSTRLNSSH